MDNLMHKLTQTEADILDITFLLQNALNSVNYNNMNNNPNNDIGVLIEIILDRANTLYNTFVDMEKEIYNCQKE